MNIDLTVKTDHLETPALKNPHHYLNNRLMDGSVCDECALRALCASQRIACSAFRRWQGLKKAEGVSRLPDAKTFNAIYA